MKKILSAKLFIAVLFSLTIVLILASCVKVEFSTYNLSMHFSSKSETKSLTLESDFNWKAPDKSDIPEWITIVKVEGDKQEYQITVDENETGRDRSTIIGFTDNKNLGTTVLTIIQDE